MRPYTDDITAPPNRIDENGIEWIAMIDAGQCYIQDGERKAFIDAEGKPFIGLLDGAGGPLADDAEPVFLWIGLEADEPAEQSPNNL